MITKIDIPIYNTSVTLLVEITEEEFEEFYQNTKSIFTYDDYKALKEDLKNKKIFGCTISSDNSDYFLYLRNGKDDNIVSHEIFHVCNKILLERGVEIDESAEPWAYLIGWFTEEYYRRYWEYHDNLNKD